jgi:hypothetical protein
MPDNAINTFKNNFFGGTRPNRFEISASTPNNTKIDTFHTYAFNLPEIAIGEIPVNYRGRTVYVPGDRDYMPWNITILDDRNASIYNALQDWQNKINDHEANTAADGFATGNRGEWVVKHLDTQVAAGTEPLALKTFTLVGCWLTGIGPVQLNAAEKNALLTFNATVRYDYIRYAGDSNQVDPVGAETFEPTP